MVENNNIKTAKGYKKLKVWQLADELAYKVYIVSKEFPKEEHLDQRLILFLQQMNSLRYINL